jgi:hypothetical protein
MPNFGSCDKTFCGLSFSWGESVDQNFFSYIWICLPKLAKESQCSLGDFFFLSPLDVSLVCFMCASLRFALLMIFRLL